MKELTLHSESYITPEAISICIEPSKSILDRSPIETIGDGGETNPWDQNQN
jgi:hypothetical protein